MLEGIYGNRGSGKTILNVFHTLKAVIRRPDIPIKANFKIESPNYKPLEVFELLNLNPDNHVTIVDIDEAYTWLESRISSTKLNRYVSYIGFQSRKRNLDILFTAQLSSSVDVRFRATQDYSVFCKDRPNPRTSKEDFHYVFCRGNKLRHLTMKFSTAKKLFARYNTDEVVLPPDIGELQAEMEVLDPRKLNLEVAKLVQEIRKRPESKRWIVVKDITKDVVSDILLKLGKPKSFAPFVYVRLRSQLQTKELDKQE